MQPRDTSEEGYVCTSGEYDFRMRINRKGTAQQRDQSVQSFKSLGSTVGYPLAKKFTS